MTHKIFVDINPNYFAGIVVAGMVIAGLVLGCMLDKILSRIGINLQRETN